MLYHIILNLIKDIDMSRKFDIIIDTETTINDTVADFAAVIVDRKGNIVNQCGVLVKPHFDYELFYNESIPDWSKFNAEKKKERYLKMLETGSRMYVTVSVINKWLSRVVKHYNNPRLTAYNLPFDLSKCRNTGIDLDMFENKFCLWQASINHYANTRKYKQFVLDSHGFNSVTSKGNMTFKTNAEIMARFVLENSELPNEPHTALEDIIDYELPILRKLLKSKRKIETIPYDWKKFQVNQHFKPI